MFRRLARDNKLALLLVVVVVVGGSTLVGASWLRNDAESAGDGAPNVVLVMADDMRPDEMERVADLHPEGGFAWLRDHGLRFPRLWSTNNVCCPGKTTVLTGQTSYNHGVLDNVYADVQNSLPLWLQQAGYCTAYTGKYINGYDASKPRPAGWTHWEPLVTFVDEYGFEAVRRDGTVYTPEDVFITDHLARVAREQFADCRGEGKPAFVSLWGFAPHFYSEPEPEYADVEVAWSNPDPTFDEADISDKPAWLQGPFASHQPNYEATMAGWHAARVRTLLSLDDALEGLIDGVEARGELRDTLFVLTSDNGYLLGEHRLDQKKELAYEAAQPALWIAGPGFPAGETSDAYALNLDVAPTVLRATGAQASDLLVDGRPLQSVLAEPDLGHDRFLPIRVPPLDSGEVHLPQGDGVRTWRYKYLAYVDGTEELYDLAVDPFEETNVAGDPAYLSIKTDLVALAQRARACAGATCRGSAPPDLR